MRCYFVIFCRIQTQTLCLVVFKKDRTIDIHTLISNVSVIAGTQ